MIIHHVNNFWYCGRKRALKVEPRGKEKQR